MADLPPLRQTENGATSAERDALRGAPVRAAAALALAAAVFLAVVAIAGLGRLDADVVFLQKALGPEKAQAPLRRQPAPGVDVRIHEEGYTVTRNKASLSLAAEGVGHAEWKRHIHGVTRETDFGAETIVVRNGRTEEFLTVVERQGERTWRWQLATKLVPQLEVDGSVHFFDPGRMHPTGLSLDPVGILDEHGRDITPKGLRWGLDDDDGTWWLTLKLDDSKLPLPYVIDPAANYPTPLNLRSTATSETGSWALDGGTGAVDTTTDNAPARNATGWYAWNPSASNTTRLAALPATTDGMGWIVDPAGGATGFPAGNWSFTVRTDIPSGTFVAGAAVLTVGVWKGTVAGGTFTPTGTILTPTDDPAAQNLRTSVNPTNTTATYSLPAFSIAAGETLFVDYWRHQTGGINSFTSSQRRLDFYVNDGNATIAHPAADDTAPSHSLSVTELTNPGGQYFDAATATQYYNTAAGGTFRVDDAAGDAGSGVASATFPALAATGFTHTATTDTTSPYQSNTYTWTTANTTSPGAQAVSAVDNALNSSSPSPQLTLTRDVAAPSGQTLALVGGPYYTSLSVSLSAGDGSDAGAGLETSSRLYERDSAPLTNGSCGAFSGTWTTVANPDTTVTSGSCYRYRYSIADNVGNRSATVTAPVDARVDTSAPGAPSLALAENPADPAQHVSGTTLYYRPGAGGGTFRVTASASDGQSGIASVAFPAIANVTGGGSDGSSPYEMDYTWSASTVAGGNQNVTATNNAGLVSANGPFVLTQDGSVPSTTDDAASIGSGWKTTSQVVTLTPADGAGSGVAATYYTTDGSTPTTSSAQGTTINLTTDGIHTIKYFSVDNVGNAEPVRTASTLIHIDATDPSSATLDALPGAIRNGQELTGSGADVGSGVDSITYLYCSGTSCTPATSIGSSSTGPDYSVTWSSMPADGDVRVLARVADVAGNTLDSAIQAVVVDNTGPTGSLTAPADASFVAGSVTVSSNSADSGSGVASAQFERRPAGGGSWTSIATDSTSPYSVSWDTTALADGDYDLRVVTSDQAGNTSTSSTRTVTVDNTAPSAPVLTLSESSPYAYVSGTEIFLNTNETGSYDVEATSADGASGIAKVTFPGALEDTSAPYQASYGFLDLFGTQTVTAHNGAGLTSSADFEVSEDVDAPSTSDDTSSIGTTWQTSPVTVTLAPVDSGAGVAATYYTTDGSLPTTSSAQGTTINLSADGVYVIRYFSVDRVGNEEPVRTAFDIIRIDKTNPAQPTISLSESTPYAYVSGSEIFVNTAQSGTYDVGATSSDATAGIERIAFPGGVDDFTSPYSASYGLGDLAGLQTVTAHDYAGNSAGDTFTVTPDTAAPTGGSVSYTGGYDADGQVAVAVDAGNDAGGSGIAAGSGVLERRTSALAGDACAAFAGAWSAVTSPDTVASGLCAQYRYRVSDHVSNEATYGSGAVVKVDLDEPQTAIDSAPSDPSADVSPSFAFSSNETGTTFECRLDSGSWTACTSPEPVGPLTDGSHDFEVRATDSAGNTDPTPASYTWTVDTAAPQTTIVLVPADPSNDDAPTFEFESDEPGSGFECRVDAGPWTPCTSPEVAGLLADGGHTFQVRAIDGAGNADPTPASYTWTVDTAAPDTTFTTVPGSPSNDPSPSFEFDSSEPGSTFECRLDGSIDWDPCASPAPVGPLADGSHTFDVRATDPAGNTDGTPASHTWTVDTGAPPVTITQPSGFVNASDADPYTVRATSPDADVASVELFSCSNASAGCAAGSWISLGTDSTAPFEASWPVDPDGNRALRAEATDTASNVDSAVVDVTIDRTVPDTTIDSAPSDPSADASPSFDFSSNEAGTTFECRLDAGAWTACASPEAYSGLADGSHTFRARATDGAGNTDATPAVHSWTVDTAAPQTTIDSAPSDPSSNAAPAFDFSSSEPGSTFECRLDAGAWTACASPEAYSGLADGNHTFSVRAIDAAGNTDPTPDSHAWTIDATPPGGGLADPGQYLRGTVALSASPSDTGVGVQGVDFQVSPADAGSWSSVDVDTTAPYGAVWDTTLVADGLYDLRAVVTDNAGNSTASAVVEDRMVDNTAPSATMNDPGAYLRATVGLTSNVGDSGSGVASVAYQRSPANAGNWTAVPASWNTTSVADGLYDLRVVVTDNAGNSTAAAAVEDRTVDNTKPGLSASDPFDGTTLAAAGTLQVVASEDVSGIAGATIDGAGAPAPSVSGDTVTYTQSFATGPHTLAGELEDLAGNRQPIRVHFTVWSGTASDYPYVEKNSFAAAAMSLAATNGASTLTVPAGAWSGAPAGDWLVLRLDPQPSTGVSGGFQPAGDVLDVTAYWALAGTGVTSFSTPLELEVDNTLAQVVPATFESGAWRAIAAVPGSGLPGSWQDGFERDGTNVRIFTRHLSRFTLLQDVQAPGVPGKFKGTVRKRKFSLSWKAASDNSGLVAGYRVYANSAVVKAVGGSTLTAAMGAFTTTDKKAYTVAAVDQAGNVGSRTYALKVVPKIAKLTLSSAKKALEKRGFKAGRITYKASAKVPQGKVIKASAAGLRRSGTKVGLTVSKGGGAAHRPVPPTYPTYPPATPYPPSTAPSYTPPPAGSTPPPPTPTPPVTAAPDPTATGTGTALPGSVRLAPHKLLLAESDSDFDSLRRELGFVLMAAAFTFAFLAGLRARRPREETEGADPELLWDSRALQSVGRALRRLTGRP
ncbi:MAG TPA: Ig-like domain-containing protein [Gaiellaceae bacterium]|nr:Ig-like domain-containing protein [Gaiellaceae bacterium]